MPNKDHLNEALFEYQKQYRNPSRPEFEISEIYDVDGNWQNGYIPYAEKCGCYVFYDSDGEICYIGKASLSSSLGARVCSYFLWKEGAQLKHKWNKAPIRAQVIAVTDPFEAPSLEEFLIQRLKPSDNIRKGKVAKQED